MHKIKQKYKKLKGDPRIRNNRYLRFLYKHRVDIFLLSFLLLVGAILHGYNMFNFPYYENDEGTYLSRAWSLLEHGKLDPYTYWYDHVPFASFFIAGWVILTGGFDTFGMTANSGRVFMLFLFLINVLLIYYISWRMTKRRVMGVVASLLFIISPLSIYFSRRLLLDNMIIIFMLLTLAILLKEKLSLRWILISAITFAFGVLTKENVVLFMPIYLAIIFVRTKGTNRFLSLLNWLIVAGAIIGLYFLYALLKKELFFPGSLGTPEDSVSLFYTLKFHLGRGNGLPFWQEGSDFMGNFLDWLGKDPIIIYLGAISLVGIIPLSVKYKWARVLLGFSLIHAWFLMRGSLILNFYIVPVIPIVALNVGYIADWIVKFLTSRTTLPKQLFYVYIMALMLIYFATSPKLYLTVDENEGFREAVSWIKKNADSEDIIVIDNAIFVDMNVGTKKFRNAEWFWKVDTDPEVYKKVINEDWKRINYIFLSHETVKQLESGAFLITQTALENSIKVASWQSRSTAYVDVEKYISTNGDWGMMFKVPSENDLREDKTWQHIKDKYIISYGQVYDPELQVTTSYMQTSAMNLAVLADDPDTFEGLRAWTSDHFKHRLEDELLSSVWTQADVDSDGVVSDTSTRSRADVQYIATLLMAYEKWGNEEYKEEALGMLESLWNVDVIELRGRYYISSGSAAAIFNPAISSVDSFYVDPYAGLPGYLDLFIKYDPERNWQFVKEDWYLTVNNIIDQRTPDNSSQLMPENMVLSLDGMLSTQADVNWSSLSVVNLSINNLFKDSEDIDEDNTIDPSETLINKIEPTIFEPDTFEDKLIDQNSNNLYLVGEILSLIKSQDLEYSYYQYLFEKGFNYETGEWEQTSDLTTLFLLWSIIHYHNINE